MEALHCFLMIFSSVVLLFGVDGQNEWRKRDSFDEIQSKLDMVTADNCYGTNVDDLYLPKDAVSHYPDPTKIYVDPVFPNRTAMFNLHNMAMNRAFFWSYILQSRFIRPSIDDTNDPGMMYYFLSSIADVSANPYINASSIYFSPNTSYTSSYRGFFNKTLSIFAPRAYRVDFNSPGRLPNIFHVEDLGAFEPETSTKDYTSDLYRVNEWYRIWLPDEVDKTHNIKTTYRVEIRYANDTNQTFTFYGPRGNEEILDAVNWTRPYFDCGRLNKWVVAAVSPVADIYPRHTQFRHIEYPTYTAAVVMEMDYDRIDINQCPPSLGNYGPNRFAGTARCKEETTECEPLHGRGFRRGGYQCRCKPGYRLPEPVPMPYLGESIEHATTDQYNNNFQCLKIGHTDTQRLPHQRKKGAPFINDSLVMDEHYEHIITTIEPVILHAVRPNVIYAMLNFTKRDQADNYCSRYNPPAIYSNEEVAQGAKELFGNQAYTAVRLANFISAFLQISDPDKVYNDRRVPDKPLTEDQMFGETFAIIMGDSKIWSAGTYWDRNKFTNRTFFAPFAYKTETITRNIKLEDLARLDKTDAFYLDKNWFSASKQRWVISSDALEKFNLKIKLRYDENGRSLRRYERYPTSYRAANIDQGYWTRPYYDCDGHLNQWVITYAAPFFGWDNQKVKLEFNMCTTKFRTSFEANDCKIYECLQVYEYEYHFKNKIAMIMDRLSKQRCRM